MEEQSGRQDQGDGEQDELQRQREEGERDQAEGDDEATKGDGGAAAATTEDGAEIERAQPEREAEEETTEDIDRAFD